MLTYYGVRYYDQVLLAWTQGDSFYRRAPEQTGSAPRRANLYNFSLNNPLRYVDPDGRDPFAIVGRIGTPSREIAMSSSWRGAQSQASSGGADAEQSVLAGIQHVMTGFQISTPITVQVSTEYFVKNNPNAHGVFRPSDNSIVFNTDISNYSFGNIDLAMLAVHEISHSEDFSRGGFFRSRDSSEIFAFVAQQRVLKKLLDAGSIDQNTYNNQMSKIGRTAQAYSDYVQQVVARAAVMHLAAAFMPDMHAHVSLFSDVYRSRNAHYINGLWGLELNAKGPSATPAKP
jgi:RHS repeat-associated protein